nr:FAD-dependent oxidoreductase [Bacillus subtilis]
MEYRTDDARLTIEVMKEAVKFGAEPVNYSKVKELLYEKGKAVGVLIEDVLTKKEYKVYAKKIVNATGTWVDQLREKDHSKNGKHLRHTKGIHLVFDQSVFPLKQAVYFDTPDGTGWYLRFLVKAKHTWEQQTLFTKRRWSIRG